MKRENTGDFLRRLRAGLGVSQAELAAAAGVSRKQISDWECGRKVPSGDRLLKIIKVAESKEQEAAPAKAV